MLDYSVENDNAAGTTPSCGENFPETVNDSSNSTKTLVISIDTFAGDRMELTDDNISFSYDDLSLNQIENALTINKPETESNLVLYEDVNPIQNLTFIDSLEDISNLHPHLPAPRRSFPEAATTATTNDSKTNFVYLHMLSKVELSNISCIIMRAHLV